MKVLVHLVSCHLLEILSSSLTDLLLVSFVSFFSFQVCQTMTYLLKSEVDKDELQNEITALKEKCQQFSSSSSSAASSSGSSLSTFHITSSQKSFLLPDLSSQKVLNRTPPPPPSKASSFHTTENDAMVGRRMKALEKETEEIISNLDLKFEKVQDYQASSSSPFMLSYPTNISASSTSSNSSSSSSSSSSSFFYEDAMKLQNRPLSFVDSPFPSSSSSSMDGFTGSSPTDLLFSPAVLSKATPKSSSLSSNVSSLRPTSSSTTTFMIESSKNLSSHPSTAAISAKNTVHVSDLNTPIASFRSANGISSHSFHLTKTEGFTNMYQKEGNGREEEEEDDDDDNEADNYYDRHHYHHSSDLSFERDDIEKLKDRILSSSSSSTTPVVTLGIRDSSESTIERLSYQFTNSLTTAGATTSASASAAVIATPSLSSKINLNSNVNNPKKNVKSNRKEEQSTIVIPNESIPIPMQPSKHPFSSSVKYSSSSTPTSSFNNKENHNFSLLTTEKKVYDARYGSF
jgi:hypothetical protein